MPLKVISDLDLTKLIANQAYELDKIKYDLPDLQLLATTGSGPFIKRLIELLPTTDMKVLCSLYSKVIIITNALSFDMKKWPEPFLISWFLENVESNGMISSDQFFAGNTQSNLNCRKYVVLLVKFLQQEGINTFHQLATMSQKVLSLLMINVLIEFDYSGGLGLIQPGTEPFEFCLIVLGTINYYIDAYNVLEPLLPTDLLPK